MASAGSRSSCPRSGRRWSSPPTTRARPTRRAVLRDALRQPVAGPPLSELARPGHEGRDLDVRRHPRAAARQDDPGRAGRAGRARRGRRDPRRDRHAPRQHRRGDPGDARRRASSSGSGSSTTTRATSARSTYLGEHGHGVPVWINTRVGRGRPADHDRVRRAALLRRLQRRAEARHARAGGAGHGARAPRRGPDRRSEGHVGRHRGQPRPRRHPRRLRPPRRRTSPST